MAKQSKGCLTFIGLGVFFVLAVVVAVYVVLSSGRTTASEHIDAIRARGEPTSLGGLNEYYAEPDGPNAAPLFIETMATLNGLSREERGMLLDGVLPSGEPVFPAAGDAMSEEARAAVDMLLAEHAEARALIAEAVEIGEARFPVDFEEIGETEMGHLSGMRQLTRWMAFEAVAKAHAGDAAGAADALVNAFGTVEALSDYPSLMAALTRASMMGIAIDGFVDTVNRIALSTEHLDRLRAAIASAYSGESAKQGLIGERAFLLSPGGPWDANLLIFMMDRARMLDIYAELIASTEQPPRHSVALLEELETPGGGIPGFLHPYSRIIVPPLLRALESHVRVMTQQQLALLVCDIERRHRDTGELPENLNAAGISVPDDPYANGAVNYVGKDSAYIVYSVGPDGIDGGAGSHPANIAIRVAR